MRSCHRFGRFPGAHTSNTLLEDGFEVTGFNQHESNQPDMRANIGSLVEPGQVLPGDSTTSYVSSDLIKCKLNWPAEVLFDEGMDELFSAHRT